MIFRKYAVILLALVSITLQGDSLKLLPFRHELDMFDDEELESMVRTGLIYEIIDTTNAIKIKTDTLKTSLSQEMVGNSHSIILQDTGTYVLVDNIFCDVLITGTNVTLDLSGKSIFGTINISGSTIILKNGAIVAPPPFTADLAAIAGLTIDASATMVRVKECHIACLSSMQTMTQVEQAIPGRNALAIKGAVVDIQGCSFGAGSGADTMTLDAADGGTVVVIGGLATKVRMLDCIMVGGNGGNALTGNGGNGGHGIQIKDSARLIEIKNCTIFETGDGGTSDGNGGHGITIESGVADVAIYGCHIRNTGQGTGAGVGGKAIQDAVTIAANYSIIYSNVAHNIANALKFDLQALGVEKGIQSPIIPDGTVINPLANVYFS